MTRSLTYALTVLLFLALTPSLFAQNVRINEYSAANLDSFPDAFGKTEDWIELYNAGSTEQDLTGWHLSDKESKPTKYAIPAGTTLPAGGYLLFWCSGRDLVTAGGQLHTNFKLTQTKADEVVLLSDPDGNVQEVHPLTFHAVEHAHARRTDGINQWAISTRPTPGASNNGSPQVEGYTAEPTAVLPAGFYDSTVEVSFTNNAPGTTLRYTTDGTNPTASSPVYTGPISVSQTTVVKARSFSDDPAVLPGKLAFATYFIDESFTLPVFSVAADELLDLAAGMGELRPTGSLEYFTTDGELAATSFGRLNRHGQDSWVLPHRSLDWVSRDEMGYSRAVEAQLFNRSERDSYQKFMFRNSGDDNYPAIDDFDHQGSTHVRDEYVQTLAAEGGMKLDTRIVERVIVFLNGIYWGVYGMRERPVDHDYTEEYYDQGKYEIQYLSTWGTTEIEYGGVRALNDWERLRDFILENDMGNAANYELVGDSLNLTSLTDYMLVNLNTVASDWLNYNTGWWRGLNPEGDHKKWGYILWDLDATFDYYINYTGVPTTDPDALVCDIDSIASFVGDFFDQQTPVEVDPANCPTLGTTPYPTTDSVQAYVFVIDPYCCQIGWDETCQELYDETAEFLESGGTLPDGEAVGLDGEYLGNIGKHELIFLKLIEENEDFRQLYYSRYADMANTVFSCENMHAKLDSMIATIAPEMPRQIQRWGGSMSEWRSNVNRLRNFIDERCNLLPDNLPLCYDELTGPYTVTLLAEPAGVGEIDFNTLDVERFPWTGSYYGGMENKIKARVFDEYEDEYVFSHWESRAGSAISPDTTTRKARLTLTESDTLVAVFTLLSSAEELTLRYGVEVYPNPTAGDLRVDYRLDRPAPVGFSLYTPVGRRVADFPGVVGPRAAGDQTERLRLPAGLANGIYLLRMSVGKQTQTLRVAVIR